MIDSTHNLRKLAKSNHWQTIFAASKILNGINIFNNTTEFTNIQIDFVNWLAYYNSLNYYLEDGSMPEWAYKKDIYIDAFMHYIRKKEKKEKNKIKNDSLDIGQTKDKNVFTGLKINFKSKNRE